MTNRTFTVNLPDFKREESSPIDDRMILDKINSSIREFNHLLTSQLEIQRNYFEQSLENESKNLERDFNLSSMLGELQELKEMS